MAVSRLLLCTDNLGHLELRMALFKHMEAAIRLEGFLWVR